MKVLFYFSGLENKAVFSRTLDYYLGFYQGIAELAAKQGVRIIMAGEGSYKGGGKFSPWYEFKHGQLERHEGIIQVEVIHLRGTGEFPFPTEGLTLINHPDFSQLEQDKLRSSEQFRSFSPKTLSVGSETLTAVLKKIPGKTVVLKPNQGYGGRGIIIKPKAEVTAADLPTEVPYVAQQFIETSSGIPGIAPGRHDLRLFVFNGQVKFSFVRLARPEGLVSNLIQGGSIRVVDVESLPPSALQLAAEIDKEVAGFGPRFYAVDIMFSKGRPYLSEINVPGLGFLNRSDSDISSAQKMAFTTALLEVFRGGHQIAVYFDTHGKMGYPFNDEGYFRTYAEFSQFCNQRQLALTIVRAENYLGGGTFSKGWRFHGKKLIPVRQAVSPELLYIKGKGSTMPEDIPEKTINHPDFETLGADKYITYRCFGDLMPKSYVATLANLQKIRTKKVVLKPIRGLGGEGVYIISKWRARRLLGSLKEDYLLQEFVDTRGGIPGLVKGVHDLRVIVFNGTPRLATIRQPRKGLISNIALGGTVQPLPIEKVPEEVMAMVARIEEDLRHFPYRIYTADFMHDKNRFYLCEINTRPGFPKVHGEVYKEQFFTGLADVFLAALTPDND